MKTLFSPFATFVLLLVFFAFAPALPPAVSIKKSNFKFGDVSVSSNWSIESFVKVLGQPDRQHNGYNKVHTYDNLGILLFEKMTNKVPSGTVIEIQFHYKVIEPNELTPVGNFNGSIQVDKQILTTRLTPSEMKKNLRKWKEEKTYADNAYRMSNGIFYTYFQFDTSETSLVRVSVGKEKK